MFGDKVADLVMLNTTYLSRNTFDVYTTPGIQKWLKPIDSSLKNKKSRC